MCELRSICKYFECQNDLVITKSEKVKTSDNFFLTFYPRFIEKSIDYPYIPAL